MGSPQLAAGPDTRCHAALYHHVFFIWIRTAFVLPGGWSSLFFPVRAREGDVRQQVVLTGSLCGRSRGHPEQKSRFKDEPECFARGVDNRFRMLLRFARCADGKLTLTFRQGRNRSFTPRPDPASLAFFPRLSGKTCGASVGGCFGSASSQQY